MNTNELDRLEDLMNYEEITMTLDFAIRIMRVLELAEVELQGETKDIVVDYMNTLQHDIELNLEDREDLDDYIEYIISETGL